MGRIILCLCLLWCVRDAMLHAPGPLYTASCTAHAHCPYWPFWSVERRETWCGNAAYLRCCKMAGGRRPHAPPEIERFANADRVEGRYCARPE